MEFVRISDYNLYNAADIYELPKICQGCIQAIEEKENETPTSTLYASVTATTLHPVWSWLLLEHSTLVRIGICDHKDKNHFMYKLPLWVRPVFNVGRNDRERIQSYIYLDTCAKSEDAADVAETMIALTAVPKDVIASIVTKFGPIIHY